MKSFVLNCFALVYLVSASAFSNPSLNQEAIDKNAGIFKQEISAIIETLRQDPDLDESRIHFFVWEKLHGKINQLGLYS